MSTLVAQTLRQARQERGVTVQAAAHALDIAADALLALEQGDVRALGTKLRAKAIVRAYARWLGVDAEPLLLRIDDTWDTERPAVEPAPPDMADPDPLPEEPQEPAWQPVEPAEPAWEAPEPLWEPAEPAWEPPAAAWEPAEAEPLAPVDLPPSDLPRPPGGNSRARSAPPATVPPRRRRRRQRSARRRLWLAIALLALIGGALLARMDLRLPGGDQGNLVSLDENDGTTGRTPAGAVTARATRASATTSASPTARDQEHTVEQGNTPAAEPEPTDTSVQVLNASGDPEVLADAVAVLQRLGYEIRSTSAARQLYEVTTVFYSEGRQPQAEQLVEREPRFHEVRPNDRGLDETIDLHVVVGQDWRPVATP